MTKKRKTITRSEEAPSRMDEKTISALLQAEEGVCKDLCSLY